LGPRLRGLFEQLGDGLFQLLTTYRSVADHSLPVDRVAFSPEGDRLLSCSDDFLRLWTSPFERTVFKNRWLGIETLQNPNDMWITQEILFDVKPDFLVEAGTRHGGSAAIWAMILEQINPEARVITIDIEDQVTEAKELDIFRRKVDFLVGSSTDPKIVADVKRRTQGKKVVVLLDSAHTKDHVLNELKIYSPLVGIGSYVIVQDTVVNGHPIWPEWGPGPYEAVEEFLEI
jgi:cephalosporin hydroxylase